MLKINQSNKWISTHINGQKWQIWTNQDDIVPHLSMVNTFTSLVDILKHLLKIIVVVEIWSHPIYHLWSDTILILGRKYHLWNKSESLKQTSTLQIYKKQRYLYQAASVLFYTTRILTHKVILKVLQLSSQEGFIIFISGDYEPIEDDSPPQESSTNNDVIQTQKMMIQSTTKQQTMRWHHPQCLKKLLPIQECVRRPMWPSYTRNWFTIHSSSTSGQHSMAWKLTKKRFLLFYQQSPGWMAVMDSYILPHKRTWWS